MKALNKLPKGWQLVPLKSVAEHFVSSVDKHTIENEEPVRLCNYTDVYKNEFLDQSMVYMKATATDAEIESFKLEVGDVVITKDSETWDDIAVPAYITETADDFICGYHLAVIRGNKKYINSKYLFRIFQTAPIISKIQLEAKGVTRVGLPKDAVGSAKIPLPPLKQQASIVSYLDEQIEKIDRLIFEKNKMLRLFADKSVAIISDAITSGINPNVKKKKSGVEWIGEIPEHWGVTRFKNLLQVRDQRSKDGSEELLTVSHITGVTSRSAKDVNMFEADDKTGYKCCYKGDFVTNTLWAWMGAMGTSPLDGIVSPAYHVYKTNEKLLPSYLNYICKSKAFITVVTTNSKGVWSSRLRLYPESFLNILVPVVPIVEQEKIVKHIETELAYMKNLELELRDSIELLIEKRSSLITSIVTGRNKTS